MVVLAVLPVALYVELEVERAPALLALSTEPQHKRCPLPFGPDVAPLAHSIDSEPCW